MKKSDLIIESDFNNEKFENKIGETLETLCFEIKCPPDFARHQENIPLKKMFSFYKILKIYINVQRFKILMKKSLKSNKLKEMPLNALAIIDDLSASYRNLKTTDFHIKSVNSRQLYCYSLIYGSIDKFLKWVPVFNYESNFVKYWFYIDNFIKLFMLLIVPLDLSFSNEYCSSFDSLRNFLNVAFLNFYFCDIILKMNTSFFWNGKIVSNKKQIFANYIKNHLKIDMLSNLPFFLLIIVKSLNYEEKTFINIINFLFFLKIKFLAKIKIYDDFKIRKLKKRYVLLFLLYLYHFLACIWYFFSQISTKYFAKTWILSNNLDLQTILEKYITSLTYITETFCFQSHSINGPQNILEKTVYIFIMVLSKIIGILLFSFALIIVFNKNKFIEEYLKENIMIKRFLNENHYKPELKRAVENEIELLYRKKSDFDYNDSIHNIIKKFPVHLQEELFKRSYDKILKKFDFFHTNFSKETNKKLNLIIKKEKYYKGNKIFDLEEKNLSLFYIESGKVAFSFKDSSENKFSLRNSKEIFGQIEFFTGFPIKYSTVCEEDTNICKIERDKFIQILKEDSSDYEKFCEIRDKIALYHNYENLNLICFSCGEKTHIELECSLLHYISYRKNSKIQIKFKDMSITIRIC